MPELQARRASADEGRRERNSADDGTKSMIAANPFPKPCYVALHLGTGPSNLDQKNSSTPMVAANSRFQLCDDIWIERLEEQLAKNVYMACEPAHYKIESRVLDQHLYAFVRRVPEKETRNYEGLEMLHTVLALSRLIRPTSIGSRYCAKIYQCGMAESNIYAVQYRGISPDVFLSSYASDWLSVEDAEELRKLMPWLTKATFDRIYRALWYHEYAMRSSVLDLRLPLAVTGLEALINTDATGNKKQFCGRVSQLAMTFGIDLDVEKAWVLRSKLAHAEAFLYGLGNILPQREHTPLYEKLEEVLRSTVRRSLLDQSFAEGFKDADAVRSHWPV